MVGEEKMKEVLRSEMFSQALRAVVVAINMVLVVTAACVLPNHSVLLRRDWGRVPYS